jgi:alpha(1,3/1,4) fucosyltransferase
MALKVGFTDLWPNANPERSFLLRALRETTPAVVTAPDDADVLFFSVFGLQHANFVGTKIQYSGENTRPRWSETDFHIGCNHLADPRHLRFPFYAAVMIPSQWSAPPLEPGPPWRDREFCLFLVSHETRRRVAAFEALSRYRPVTSAGNVRRTVRPPDLEPRDGRWRPSKLLYQRNFRFTIAYEHTAAAGYTSEKLIDALLAGTIPIYWGNPRVDEDVHPECFINSTDFESLEHLVDHVRRVDTDEELASTYLARTEFLVRSIDDWWNDLVVFLGEAAATVGTRSRRREHVRAVREQALTQPRRAVWSLRRRVVEALRRG